MDEDNTVTTLEQQLCDLDIRVDDLEQQGCRGSICVWRILEDTPVSVDAKFPSPCKKQMKVLRPLILEDLELVYRLGKPAQGTAGSVMSPFLRALPRYLLHAILQQIPIWYWLQLEHELYWL